MLLTNLSLQSLEGTRDVLRRIEENPFGAETGRQIETLLVATPVHGESSDQARDAVRRAARVLGRPFDLQIPFSAAAAFDERLWSLDPSAAPSELLARYATLGKRLLEAEAEPAREVAAGDTSRFAATVRRLFEIEGYDVSEALDAVFDLRASREAFPTRTVVGIQLACGPGRRAGQRVREIVAAVEEQAEVQQALICTEREPSPALRRAVGKDPRVSVVSADELAERVIDFRAYLRWLRDDFTEDVLSGYYEPLGLLGMDGRSGIDRADDYLARWLDDPDGQLLTLLGDFGTGKTSLCRRLAARLAGERLDEERWSGRVPVLISLRNYSKALSVEHLVGDLLGDRRRFSGGSFAAFDHLNREGKLLILLDGFDEMATRADERVVLENFRELKRLVHPRAKVLLTCRTHYFQTRGQADSVLAGKLVEEAREPAGSAMVELAPLTAGQIERLVRRRANDPERVLRLIRETYDLTRLASRPVLLDLILKTVPELDESEERLNAARLYQVYTDRWVSRDTWRARLTADQRARLMEALALRMVEGGAQQVHYGDLRVFVREQLGEQVASLTDLDHFDYDVRTCSFVNRDDEGNYRFMHKSFQEFFLARAFARELSEGDGGAAHFGLQVVAREVIAFLAEMDDVPDERLWALVREPPDTDADYRGGNAGTVLVRRGRLLDRDLSGASLRRVDLAGADLSGHTLRGADLREANLLGANLAQADLREARLGRAAFGASAFERVSFGWRGRLLVGHHDGGAVSVWDLETGRPRTDLPSLNAGVFLDAEAHATEPFIATLEEAEEGTVLRWRDLRDGTGEEAIPLGAEVPCNLALDPHRCEAVVTGSRGRALLVRHADRSGRAEVLEVGDEGAQVDDTRAICSVHGFAVLSTDGFRWFPRGETRARKASVVEARLAFVHQPLAVRSAAEVVGILRAGDSLSLARWDFSQEAEDVVAAEPIRVDGNAAGWISYFFLGPVGGLFIGGGPEGCVLVDFPSKTTARVVGHVDDPKNAIKWMAVDAEHQRFALAYSDSVEIRAVPGLEVVQELRTALAASGADFRGAEGLDDRTRALLENSGARV